MKSIIINFTHGGDSNFGNRCILKFSNETGTPVLGEVLFKKPVKCLSAEQFRDLLDQVSAVPENPFEEKNTEVNPSDIKELSVLNSGPGLLSESKAASMANSLEKLIDSGMTGMSERDKAVSKKGLAMVRELLKSL